MGRLSACWKFGPAVLAVMMLSGCIESVQPIGDRETASDKHPLAGYWIGGAESPEDKADIISVLHTGDKEQFTVVMGDRAYKVADLEALRANQSDDTEIYAAIFSKARKAPGIYQKTGFASFKRLRGKEDIYDLLAYRLHSDGTLVVSAGDKALLAKAHQAGKLTETEYDPVHSRITADPARLADFVNEFDGFVQPAVYRRVEAEAEWINASERRLEEFFIKNDYERRLILLKLDGDAWRHSSVLTEKEGKLSVTASFEHDDNGVLIEVRRWEGSKGQFAGRTVADLVASGGAEEWAADLIVANSIKNPVWKVSTVASRQVIEVLGMTDATQYDPAEPKARLVAFDTDFGVCLIHADWPEYEIFDQLDAQFDQLIGQL